MRYLTATQAARVIGVTDRTIRDWIKAGKLSAHHPSPNRLAIPEQEVESVARERRQYQVDVPDPADLAVKVADLERKYQELTQRYEDLARRMATPPTAPQSQIETIAQPVTPSVRVRAATPARRRKGESDLPEGYILARDFALKYGVAPPTFRDHITIGLGRGEKEKVEASARPKPGREKETERYLTPDQQEKALDFWRRHGIKFDDPLTSESGQVDKL